MTYTETNTSSRNGQLDQARLKPPYQIILERLGQEFCDRHLLSQYGVERSGMLLEELQLHAETGTLNRLIALLGCELAALSMVNLNSLSVEPAKRIKKRLETLNQVWENINEAVDSQIEVLQAVQEGYTAFPMVNSAEQQQRMQDEDSDVF